MRYYPGLDVLKFTMALFIVGTHTELLCEYPATHIFLQHLFDSAVPVFFTISAFLFYGKLNNKGEEESKRVFKHTLFRLIVLYSVWWVLMLPMSLSTFFKVANIKEIMFAAVFRSTFGGYWFIKALIINIVILYFCRKKKALICFFAIGFVLYLLLAYNYKFPFLNIPFSPYYSFFYHSVYFPLGALLYIMLQQGGIAKKSLLGICVFGLPLLLFASYYAIGGVMARLLFPVVLIPYFSSDFKIENKICELMRSASVILYMAQFLFIWLYRVFLENGPTGSFFRFSPIRFMIVCIALFFLSFGIIAGERKKALSFLRYLH